MPQHLSAADLEKLHAVIGNTAVGGLAMRTRKRGLQAEISRELTPEDIMGLTNPDQPEKTNASPLARIRDTHHQIARRVAAGEKHVDIARIVGITPSWISVLLKDPTFSQLIEHYRLHEDGLWLENRQMATQVGRLTLEELRSRLMDEPENFTIKQLHEIATSLMDRTGDGPSSSHRETREIGLSADILQIIKSRTNDRERGSIISREDYEHQRKKFQPDADDTGRPSQENPGAVLGFPVERSALSGAEEAAETSWTEGEGENLREEDPESPDGDSGLEGELPLFRPLD